MDFSEPFRALTPSLDGPVLSVLARTTGSMTRAQITNLVGDASEAGVRKVLSRLVVQGIVIEERIGSRYAYRANRDHLLWPAVEIVTEASYALESRIRAEIAAWEIAPISIELLGSVAQGRSTAESDIDLVIVSPELNGSEQEMWDDQIEALRDQVQAWTGNACDITVLDPPELVEAKEENVPVLRSDRVPVAGIKIDDMNLGATSEQFRALGAQLQALYADSPAMRDLQQTMAKIEAQAFSPAAEAIAKSVAQFVRQNESSVRRSLEAATAAQRLADKHTKGVG